MNDRLLGFIVRYIIGLIACPIVCLAYGDDYDVGDLLLSLLLGLTGPLAFLGLLGLIKIDISKIMDKVIFKHK